jgi:tellurite resistance protein TerC
MKSGSAKNLGKRIRHLLRWDHLSPTVRKLLAGTFGGLILLAGIALILLPGPAFIVIPLGLAILATEFAWARHYLKKGRGWIKRARQKHWRKKTHDPQSVIAPVD